MKRIQSLLAALACSTFAHALTEPVAKIPVPPCCREGLPPGKYAEQSLYKSDAIWTSDVGKEIKLEVLRGRPQVIAMFFTNCEHSCPFIVNDMKAIEKALPAALRDKVDFILVSMDPERDTVESLRAFREKHRLGTEHWTLLRGSPEATRELAGMLGFNYQPGSPTQFAHSLLISILSPSGEVVYQQAGLGRPPQEPIATLSKQVSTAKKKR